MSALLDEATGHRRNAGIRAGGHLGGHLGFAKLLVGALASTQGALWNGKLAAESLGNAFAVRKTDRLHFFECITSKSVCVDCKYAINLAVAFCLIKMQ